MKFTIKTIFLPCIALLFSCQQKNEAKKTAIAVSTPASIDTLQKKEAMKSTSNDDLALFNLLSPIDILQPESKIVSRNMVSNFQEYVMPVILQKSK